MGLVKVLASNESIYNNPVKRNLDIKPVLIAIDSTGDEYFFESHVDDKIMLIYRPGRTRNEKYFVRAKVWTKNFKFKRVDSDYILKPLNTFQNY
jgi:hypothetical protein